MSLQLKAKFKSSPNGGQALFYDITGALATGGYSYSGNIGYADVEVVRLKIGTYDTTINPTQLTDTDDFTQYKEYVKISGAASVVDGKNGLTAGAVIVARSTSISVPAGDVWEETGFYVYPWLSTWLPTAQEVAMTIDLTRLGQSDTIIQDNVYLGIYEVYIGGVNTNFTSVIGRQYIVSSGTCDYNSSTYYAGDIFIAIDASLVKPSGDVHYVEASLDFYSSIDFNKRRDVYELITKEIGKESTRNNNKNRDMLNYLDSVSFMCETGDVALGPSKKVHDYVQFELNN